VSAPRLRYALKRAALGVGLGIVLYLAYLALGAL
jgi:hypothetical protein